MRCVVECSDEGLIGWRQGEVRGSGAWEGGGVEEGSVGVYYSISPYFKTSDEGVMADWRNG